MKKIYIADDEHNILDLMVQVLSNEGFDVSGFSSGDELLKAFQTAPCDLAILDIMMPGTDGFVLSTILRKISNIPIIIVSARDSEIDRITGISLGSDDYLTKPFSPMELVARVKAIFRRIELDTNNDDDETLIEYANVSILPYARTLKIEGKVIDLTPTEFDLMVYLVKSPIKAHSREELLAKVWKVPSEVNTKATDDLIKRLRKKLIAAGSKLKIEAVWGYGFKLTKED